MLVHTPTAAQYNVPAALAGLLVPLPVALAARAPS